MGVNRTAESITPTLYFAHGFVCFPALAGWSQRGAGGHRRPSLLPPRTCGDAPGLSELTGGVDPAPAGMLRSPAWPEGTPHGRPRARGGTRAAARTASDMSVAAVPCQSFEAHQRP
jgi:hypothetical protein